MKTTKKSTCFECNFEHSEPQMETRCFCGFSCVKHFFWAVIMMENGLKSRITVVLL